MEDDFDRKRFAILYVDDEGQSLKYFTKSFEPHFRILTASSAQEGYEVLQRHQDEIGLLMTDQRMPGEQGVQLLERARRLRPRILRILVTAHTDLDAAIQAVNAGAIYKYITKPWSVGELEATLRRALEFFSVQRERDQLLHQKLSALHRLMITDRVVSLGLLAAGLNHHIRNSLVAIRTFLDLAPSKLKEENLALDDLKNPQFWHEFYQQVQAQLNRITTLLTDLGIAAEKPASSPGGETRLSDVIPSVCANFAPRFALRRITIDHHIPESLPPLMAEPRQFRRLFELLLMDELACLPDGSRVTLRGQSVLPEPGSLPHLRLEIEDDGPGLPEDALRSVFDPFFVRHDDPHEFGINLMACYFIVYHHGGRIEVKSEPGRGTLFIITIPTQVPPRSAIEEERDFLPKLLLNESLWEKLLAGN